MNSFIFILLFLFLINCENLVQLIRNKKFDSLFAYLRRKSLMNGDEPVFNATLWNHKDYVIKNNCYSYAFNNLRKRLCKPSPKVDCGDDYNILTFKYYLKIEILESGGNILEIQSYYKCPKNYYKIYLALGYTDFHFYRQDSDGKWSHKPGGNCVSRVDASGEDIINPHFSNRKYNYENYFRGEFFCIKKINYKW
jgi:hypothetical protein